MPDFKVGDKVRHEKYFDDGRHLIAEGVITGFIDIKKPDPFGTEKLAYVKGNDGYDYVSGFSDITLLP